MPPLPDPLFKDAKDKLERLERRINDAQSFQVPRLREHTGSLALQQRYSGELREDIESCRRELEILETFVDDIVREQDRKEIYAQLDILIPKVEQLKKDHRAALLNSKRAIDSQARSQRDELLLSSAIATGSGTPNDERSASEDALMNANNAVTDALRRTTQLMQQELERSVMSTQMLEESTRTMTMTSDLYTTFGTLMNTSKTLITALEKSDWTDRLLIISSLSFFLLVVAYIIKKRVIDKGLWLAFWWVKYLPIPKSRPPAPVSVSNTDWEKPDPQGVARATDTLSSIIATSIIAALPTFTSIPLTAAPTAEEEENLDTSIISTIVDSILETPSLSHEHQTPGPEILDDFRTGTEKLEFDVDPGLHIQEVRVGESYVENDPSAFTSTHHQHHEEL